MTKQSQKDTLETEDAFESIVANDEEPGIIRGVKLLGLRSKNKRDYDTPGVRKSGVMLMEGAQVYIDHPEKPESPRSYRDKFGQIKNVRYEPGKGHFGDLHYNPEHPSAKQFRWDVKNSPNTQGLSINSKIRPGKTDSSGYVAVESLEVVRSVDIVTKPATNVGIFESESPEEDEVMYLKTLREKHPELVKSILEESKETDATESEIQTLKSQHAEAMAKLAEFQKKEEARQLRDAVESEFAEVFKDSKIDAEVQKEIFECACEMGAETRKKFKGVVSKLNANLIEVPDLDEEGNPIELGANEQVEEPEVPAKKSPPAYKPGGKKTSYNFMESVGLKAG